MVGWANEPECVVEAVGGLIAFGEVWTVSSGARVGVVVQSEFGQGASFVAFV